MRMTLSYLLRMLLGLLPAVGFVSCENQKDYYSIIMANGCQPGETKLTEACKQAILSYAPIDVPSFKVGDVDSSERYTAEISLNMVVRSLHTLLTTPLSFPKDKKMFGLATLEEAEMYDFIETFLQNEKANLNQLVVNYVLNAAPVIQYGCSAGIKARAYYTPWGIHICDAVYGGIIEPIFPETLLHEARHQAVQHNVMCNGALDCDKGMDGARGWAISLQWGMLQGQKGLNTSDSEISNNEEVLEALAKTMIFEIQHKIFALPKALQPVKTPGFKEFYLDSFLKIEW